MTGTEVHDRRCDDHVRTDLRTVVGLVLPAAEFAFDPDVRALLEARGIFGQLGPSLDPVPFGAFLALISFIQDVLVARERVAMNLPLGV